MQRSLFPATLTADQSSLTGSAHVGFGEFNGTRYRGQVFTPTLFSISYITLNFDVSGSKDLAIFLTDVDQTTNLPTGSTLAQWIIPNSQIAAGVNTFTLSPAYTNLTAGHKYAFYLAPYQNGVYTDDYHDYIFDNTNPYSGLSIKYEAATGWATDSSIDFVFEEGVSTPATRTTAGSSRSAASGRLDWFGNAQASSATRQSVPRGIAISGMEFGASSTQPTYNYFANKGFNTVRLAFNWERLQPTVGGALDTTELATLDQQVLYAKNAGLKVILDCHNFGRRTVVSSGGWTDDFANTTQATFTLPYGDHDASAATLTFRDYGRGVAGTFQDPVSPATSYIFSISFKINSSPNSYDELFLDTFYQDDNNRYSLVINQQLSTWQVRKYVASSSFTVLASGTKTWNLGQYYAAVIDVGQTTSGKLNISIDGVALYTTNSVNTDSSLLGGKVSVNPNAMNVTTKSVTLNVNGDTTSGGGHYYAVGEGTLTSTHFANLWSRIASHYASDTTIYGYDLMNEPHDMPVPTTSSNYNTTSTVTVMMQAAITAIRLVDTSHYVIAELDSWAGGQSFTATYGSNPTPWLTDSASKLVYSFHYYFDNDHSGTYAQPFASSNNSAISTDLTPILTWADAKGVNIHCGEFGVPNDSTWQVCLSTFYTLINAHSVWTNHWAAGDPYTSTTTLQPTGTDPNFVDRLQMAIVGAAANLGTLL